jgi:hypothetical protein
MDCEAMGPVIAFIFDDRFHMVSDGGSPHFQSK